MLRPMAKKNVNKFGGVVFWLLFYHIKQQVKPIKMKSYIINTDPSKCDSEGQPVLRFTADTIELPCGSLLERYDKLDFSKEFTTGCSYVNYKKWVAAIKRAKKQFAEFN